MDRFKLVSDFRPTGDQPEAIDSLVTAFENGIEEQVLLGVTGSGKTFTMANVIARLNRPTLVLAHIKRLPLNSAVNSRSFFRRTRLSISSVITIIISRKLISRTRTLSLKKTLLSTMRSNAFATAQRPVCLSAAT